MVPLWSRVVLAVALSVGTLHAQGVESNPKVSHTIELPYTLRLTAATKCEATANASMSWQDQDGAERLIWRATLVNNPAWVWVDPAGGWFATMGNECSYALDHAVVVYDTAGRVVRDLRVRDILTLDEVKRIGWVDMVGMPRTLGEDERTGNDVARGVGNVVFTPDGVWLTHPRLDRRVILTRR